MDALSGTELKVEGLTKRFGGLTAVKNVSFSLWGGEITGLIGPNGSGKSTIMKLVMGLERPDAGSVQIGGEETARWAPHRIARRGIGILFQHSRPLPRQTVIENIMLALLPDRLLHWGRRSEVLERAEWIAERVGLSEVRHRLPATLSFADLRRIELAKALARDPRILLIDEPFAGLTPLEVESFSALIAGFRENGRAVLLVDHNVRSVAALADRVIVLHHGELVCEGTAAEVTRDPEVRRIYLGEEADTASAKMPRHPAPPLLEVDKLSLSYGRARVLSEMSFSVGEGEFVAVIGHNGSGKTSLFNAISGFVDYAGGLVWRGSDMRRLGAAAIARAGIVHCPETRELFGPLTVRQNLDLAGSHLPRADMEAQLDLIHSIFPRLAERRDQAAQSLSGGEQQMLAIARSLMMRPKLLILDEPTLGLAPVALNQISDALDMLRKNSGIAVLLGEQNVSFALRHADRIHVLERGRITWTGPADRFRSEAASGYI